MKIMEMRGILAFPEHPINDYDRDVFVETSYIIHKLLMSNRDEFSDEERENIRVLSKILKYSSRIIENSYGMFRVDYATVMFGGPEKVYGVVVELDEICMSLTGRYCCISIDMKNYRYTDFVMNVVLALERIADYFSRKLEKL